MAVCVVCGKEFNVGDGAGKRSTSFCSEECKAKHRSKQCVGYIKNRYERDENYRSLRIKKSAEGNKRRREARREQIMQQLVADIMLADTSDEVRALLDATVKVKGELYAKPL